MPPRRKHDEEPLRTDDESDGSGTESAPSVGDSDPDVLHTRDFADDEEWLREGEGERRRQ